MRAIFEIIYTQKRGMNIELAVNDVERWLFINFLIWITSIDKSNRR
jgi:hypothetical protein